MFLIRFHRHYRLQGVIRWDLDYKNKNMGLITCKYNPFPSSRNRLLRGMSHKMTRALLPLWLLSSQIMLCWSQREMLGPRHQVQDTSRMDKESQLLWRTATCDDSGWGSVSRRLFSELCHARELWFPPCLISWWKHREPADLAMSSNVDPNRYVSWDR